MTSFYRFALAASAAALLAACGNNEEEATQQPDANPAATIPTPADETSAPVFVEKMAASDMYELEAARVASERAANADVKAFAAMMTQDHGKSSADLRAAVTAGGVTAVIPTTLPEAKANMLQELRDASAEDFDREYMEQQVDAHQEALNLLQRYANDGDTEALKGFASATAPVVQQHLDRARSLREGLGAGGGATTSGAGAK